MSSETVIAEDFLAWCDLPNSSVLEPLNCDDSRDSLRKHGRKKRNNMDPAKLELERMKDRKRCSRYRQRQRDEREKLQQEVAILTADLVARQKATEASRELSASAWKMLAQSELQERLNAEEQQRRLYQAVETRAAYIREFQALLQRHCSEVELEEEASVRRKRVRLDPCDDAFCDVFVQDLDAIYTQTDETMRVCGLDEVSDEHSDPKQLWQEDCGTGRFLFVDKHVISAKFQQTCEIFWQAERLPFQQEDRQDFDGVEDPENTAAFKFRVTNRLTTGSVVSVVQRVVARRYWEKHRMVLVWQSLMEGEGIFTGMRAGETGWDVLTPSTDAPEAGSVVKTCICHTSMHLSTVAVHEPALKQFTGMVLGSVADDGAKIVKMFKGLQLAEHQAQTPGAK